MNIDYPGIITRIRERRLALGYSYRELSERTGINPATLQRYERSAISDIPLRKLSLIASALNLSEEYLLTGAEPCEETSTPIQDPAVDDLVEAMHKNPRLGVLFSRSAKMDPDSVEAVLKIVELIRNSES